MKFTSRRSAFTLLELLIVIAIIAILSAMLFPAIGGVITKSKIARTRAMIVSLQAALSMYDSDTGRYPRRPGPLVASKLFENDVAYLYAALANNRTMPLGGGPNAPYIERRPEWVAHAAASDVDNLSWMSVNPGAGFGVAWLDALPSGEADQLNDASFQAANLPGSASELVFVDAWGNPLYYREWASVPASMKDGLSIVRTFQLTAGGAVESIVDRPHSPTSYDIISAGPNGIFEYGGGDDIVSTQVRK